MRSHVIRKKFIDISGERTPSIFRVAEHAKQPTNYVDLEYGGALFESQSRNRLLRMRIFVFPQFLRESSL
jgi:hypothetical protein